MAAEGLSRGKTMDTTQSLGAYREALCHVEMVEVLVHQGRLLLQQMTVQGLHNERDGVTVQMVAHVGRERFRGDEAEELGAGCHVSMGTGRA